MDSKLNKEASKGRRGLIGEKKDVVSMDWGYWWGGGTRANNL